MPWSREHRLLLGWAADVFAGRTPHPGCPPETGPSLDPSRLLSIARAERILPLLAGEGARASLPPEVFEAASRSAIATGARNALLLDLTRRACRSLAESSIGALLLKGIDLCERVYGNPSLRPMHDIDLFVRAPERFEAVAALSGAGLTAVEPLPAGELRNSVVLEGPPPFRAHVHLHWHLANSSYPLPYARRIDLDGLWRRSAPWSGAPEAARVPSAEDLCVYLCEHLVKHNCEEWVFAVDLVLALSRLRPDARLFARIAGEWGLAAVCEAALRVVDGLFPGLGVLAFREAAGRVPLTHAEHLFVRQVLSGRRGAGVNWLVYVALCPTPIARARQLWRSVFPDGADLASLDPEELSRGRLSAWAARGWKGVARLMGR